MSVATSLAPSVAAASRPASGTPASTFSVTAGALPPGLTLSAAGVLSGTPTTAGTYGFTVTAANGFLPNASVAFSLTIAAVVQVAQVAYQIGYANPSHFIAAFKRKFGVTPKKYLMAKK